MTKPPKPCHECKVKDKLIANMDALIKRQEVALDKAVAINENILSILHQAKPEGKIGKCSDECNPPHHTHYPPEVSPEKKEKEVCFDANCKEHGVKLPTPPAKEEKEVCTCASFFTVRGTHKKDCPTLTEQKGEWEEFDRLYGYNEPDGTRGIMWHPQFDVRDMFEWLAAKKKEWEAQKEQAVKAEIRERMVDMMWGETPRDSDNPMINMNEVESIINSSLLSDKVTH